MLSRASAVTSCTLAKLIEGLRIVSVNACFQWRVSNRSPATRGGFPVAEHSNLPEHNKVHDMRVFVVRQAKGGTETRQCEERQFSVEFLCFVCRNDVWFFYIVLKSLFASPMYVLKVSCYKTILL